MFTVIHVCHFSVNACWEFVISQFVEIAAEVTTRRQADHKACKVNTNVDTGHLFPW